MTRDRSANLEPQTASAIEVRIEELVLHGFLPGDHYRIGEAVERELTRLFIETGIPPSLLHQRQVHQIDAGSFLLRVYPKATKVGTEVAQAVYRGVGQ